MFTSQHQDELTALRLFILDALREEQADRHKNEDWIERERIAVADAANLWCESAPCLTETRAVTVEDMERIEVRAIGHVDYTTKLALYVAEFAYNYQE